jgi:hypothetical protein
VRRQGRSPLAGVLISFVVGVCVGVAIAPPAKAAKAELIDRAEVPALIAERASEYDLDPAFLLRIARCESGIGRNPRAYLPWAAYRGVFQFGRETWQEQAPRHGLPVEWNAAFDDRANVELAAALIAEGQTWRWRGCL